MRKVRVILEGEAKKSFLELKKQVAEENSNGIDSSKNITLLNSINQKIELLKTNPQLGRAVRKKLIPKKYSKQGITNLWIINLPDYWRMLYNLQSDELHIFCFILEFSDHDKYNSLFGFRKK